MCIEIFDEKALKAIKQLILGMVSEEEVCEYALDEQSNKLKLIKKRVKKNTLPPNTDIIKLLYNQQDKETDYKKLTDEELIKEKEKLIKQLKEEDDDS